MEAKLLYEIPEIQQKSCPTDKALISKRDDKWSAFSSDEVLQQRDSVSAGLLELELQPGDKIGLISFNRPEWNFVDLGSQQIGAIVVPMYPNISQDQYQLILEESEVKILFVENEELYNKVSQLKNDLPELSQIYSFEKLKEAKHWEEVLSGVESFQEQIDDRRKSIHEDDLASIVYTSGTTGDPKGVMLSHKNIMSNVKACLPLLPIDSGSKALSFLPLNHIFERMLTYVYMTAGVSIYYAEDLDSIADNMKEVRPNIFTTVPRLLEKIYEKIVRKGKQQNAITRAFFFGALNLAKSYDLRDKNIFYRSFLWLANKLVFSQWRKALGGQVKLIVAGGAALNPKLTRIFTAAGLPILEGYGLTETSPVISVNRWDKTYRKIGSVGKPLENVEVKIAEDQEILCKGPNVMQGYYKKEDKTNEVLQDGWFHTDDVGELDDDGILFVKDRKDSVFKTSGGKKVAPQPIENTLKESSLVDQVMVVGEGKKMVTALIAPDFENLKGWCSDNNIEFENKEEAVKKDRVIHKYDELIEQKNQEFNHTEQIKKFRLVADSWSQESGELTPTQKIKRPAIKEKYQELIETMYDDE